MRPLGRLNSEVPLTCDSLQTLIVSFVCKGHGCRIADTPQYNFHPSSYPSTAAGVGVLLISPDYRDTDFVVTAHILVL